ncbi:multicopper oxidase domain-containing protein [Oryzomonas japonica]|uniref:Multicopper oxidase domain-containing protein n=1 Tax=Oryzomonas japonica TaxID=2603858 RepID=A0A7J4ZNJ7_9BACT|nr:multicopper oxidase domain-containing protein [Oryzomonas japonica]KAB0664410.1 multicopper oxidase domain-containing protein [Oryzomonas japonica]
MKIDVKAIPLALALGLMACVVPALAFVQYGSGTMDTRNHNGATDGFIKMPDGRDVYTFGFTNISGLIHYNNLSTAVRSGRAKNHAEFPAPTLDFKEGHNEYLSLSTLGMAMRPDLFDPHTIHFHGYPNATPVFDGEPMASISVNQGADFTYFYRLNDPGTYIYHCHREAPEHMEMGMLGNLVVRPLQDDNRVGLVCADGRAAAGAGSYAGFAYNDGDCSTGYDKDILIQFADIDPAFHDADSFAQKLPFADFVARYSVLNGRGYPDTVDTAPITNNASAFSGLLGNYDAQRIHALMTINRPGGERVLIIRLSNLSIQNFATIEIPGLPVQVIGKDAKFLRRPNGKDLRYYTSSVLIGPGESAELRIDTTGVAAGTYYLYSRNLDELHADQMDRSGAMTEIRIN